MRKPKQLTLVKRYQIAILRKAGHNQTQIARHLGVHKSTISRELSRSLGKRGYRPSQAGPEACGCQAQLFPKPYLATNLDSCGASAKRRLEPPADNQLACPERGACGKPREYLQARKGRQDEWRGSPHSPSLPEEAQKTLRSALAQGTYQKPRLHRSAPRSGGGALAHRGLGSRYPPWLKKKSKVLVTLAECKSRYCLILVFRGQKSQFRLPGHTRGDCAHAQQLRDGDVR